MVIGIETHQPSGERYIVERGTIYMMVVRVAGPLHHSDDLSLSIDEMRDWLDNQGNYAYDDADWWINNREVAE